MPDTIAIRPVSRPEADGDALGTRASRFTLPPDMVAQARRRLGLIALAMAGMSTVLGTAFFLMGAETSDARIIGITVGSTAVASLAVFALTRAQSVGNGIVLAAGSLYEVLLCLSNGTIITWDAFELTGHLPEVTFAAVIIVMFPLILPSTPILVLVTSVLSGAMRPFGLFVLHWFGLFREPSGMDLMGVSFAPIGAIVLAYMGSRIVYGLGTELARARELGSYTLDEMLGRGGMGEVWRARHRMLSRPAAIKLIKPESLGESAVSLIKRFELEAQSTANLRSPHTIELYDFGTSPEGVFYYVMELLDGIDLQVLVDEHGPLPPRRVVYLLRQVCHSLHEAHCTGLVHRDIKPANIFVGRYGEDTDFVKVLDFGLVKHAKPTGPETDARLTQKNNLIGTPAFIAPEAVTGESELDARADIYALGCVAYWLLTGTLVFSSKSPMDVAIKHVRDQPEPPSSRVKQDIPAALDDIVLSCLRKSPNDRPQSAKALSEQLRAITKSAPWTEGDARKWWDETYPPQTPAPM